VRYFDKAIRRDPKATSPYDNRADAYRQMVDLNRAIADLQQAIRSEPGITPTYTNRVLAVEQMGNRGRAENDFKVAV
jgi:tetratricopeptide (TPR) repeat protein